jgi:oligo-1,6-glucosidase
MDHWWKNSVVYQIYPKSFCDSNGDGIGDLNGIRSKLDYIKWIGADVIWLSPINKSPDFDNGYDISDYDVIDERFGTMDEFKMLLAEAHARSLRIVMDLVVNHTSDRHPWFIESLSSADSPKRDYYIWRDGTRDVRPNNWSTLFGGSAWTWDEKHQRYYLHLFSSRQPDLNWENAALRSEIYEMMRRYLEMGVDGFRMDVISLLAKPDGLPDVPAPAGEPGDPRRMIASNPRVHDYIREMRSRALRGFDVLTVGEASGVTINEAKQFVAQDGSELDMMFQFEHMDLDGGETFKWNDRRIPVSEFKKVLSKWQTEFEGCGWNALFFNNHDQPRMLSRLGDEGAFREKSAKMLALCMFSLKGTPFIYQGEEIGMLNMPFTDPAQLRDPESVNAYAHYTATGLFSEQDMMRYIRLKSRDNARTPMQWNRSAHAGFTSGEPWMDVNPNYMEINVEEQMRREDSVPAFYRKLAMLRRENAVLIHGIYAPFLLEHPDVFAFTRTLGEVVALCVCNFRGAEVDFPYPAQSEISPTCLITNDPDGDYPKSGRLRPFEAAIYLI